MSLRLPKTLLLQSSSGNRASFLSTARRRFSRSSFSLLTISSLPLQGPKLSTSLPSATKKRALPSSVSSPKPSLASARLALVQSKLSYSKLNLSSDLHRQRYPYLAEIKVSCFLPPPSSTRETIFTSSILPSLTSLHRPFSPRFPLQHQNLPPNLASSLSGLFTFTRRTNAFYDHVQRFWVADPKGESEELQATTLVVLEAREMESLVRGKEGGADGVGFVAMVEEVKKFTGVGKGRLANGEMATTEGGGRVICVVLGWSCWMGNDGKDRTWRERVLGDLVVKGGCFVQDVSTSEEATGFLWTTFGHIASRRHALLDASTPEPPPPPIKIRRAFDKVARKGFNSSDTFGLMHQKITRGSEDKSRAITGEFGSLRRLLERYDEVEEGGRMGKEVLEELYPVDASGKPHSRKIGPAFSGRVHRIWSSEDPAELL